MSHSDYYLFVRCRFIWNIPNTIFWNHGNYTQSRSDNDNISDSAVLWLGNTHVSQKAVVMNSP